MNLRTICLAVSLIGTGTALDAPAATYRVGTGASCTHATIQAAIDEAAADPEVADIIRITQSLSYNDIALDIHDQHLALEGGYANCSSATTGGARTTLNGDGDHSVVRIHGDGDIVLNGLMLTGGHQPRSASGYGGGLQITNGPHLVSLTNMIVNGNDAGHGGGISVRNTHSGNPNDVQLVLSDDVVILNNHAGFAPAAGGSGIQGGGIYCNESSLRMIGAGSMTISTNEADYDGGGIGAEECDVTIASSGFGEFNGVVNNYAGRDGGGLAITGFSGGGTKLYPTDANKPVYIVGNTAAREGGGVKINSGADVEAWDLIIDGNRSYAEGGGVSIAASSDSSSFNMHGAMTGAPSGAVNCSAAKRCNRISGNAARNESDELQQGGALRTFTDGDGFSTVSSYVHLYSTQIEGNAGLNLVRLRNEDTVNASYYQVWLIGTVITGNALSNELILAPDHWTTFFLCSATIAGNAIGGADVVRGDDLWIHRSIVWQPGNRALNAGDLNEPQVRYVLASDMTGFPASTTNFIADPEFVDAANGEVHLQPSSPGLDYAPVEDDYCPGIDTEADELQRVVDLTGVGNEFGPQDLGAYERQSTADDVIFADGFELPPN